MLKRVQGNLLTLAEAGDFDVVIQGCNCFNTMGGGIAREIRQRYPHVAEVDSQTKHGDYNKLGNYTKAIVKGEDEHSFIVINAYTQYDMSTGEDVFEYVAFELILQKIARLYGNYSIGLPYIGMGLAKGDPNIITQQIENFAEQVAKRGGSVTLVEFV
jgi:O-acetyl-ADP-ribose deacetylase (regulator of RNase III)